MIEITFSGIKTFNIDNEFQLSVMKGDVGAKVSRTKLEEQPNFDKIEYLEDYKINKSLTNYLFMGGKVSVRYEYDENDGIQQRDVDKIIELNRQNPEDTHSTEVVTDNSYGFDIDYGGYVEDWQKRSADYELSTNKASMKAIEDNTIIICCLQNNYGYEFYNVDIQPNQTIETPKFRNINYLLVGDKCEVTVPTDVVNEDKKYNFEQYDCKKLSSEKCFVKNISDKVCRVVMICKS